VKLLLASAGIKNRPGSVHRRSVQVADGIVHPVDTAPPLPELEERVLHQLLRLGPVPRHEPETPKQRSGLGLVEGLEGARHLDLIEGRIREDDPFGHVECMNPRNTRNVQG